MVQVFNIKGEEPSLVDFPFGEESICRVSLWRRTKESLEYTPEPNHLAAFTHT